MEKGNKNGRNNNNKKRKEKKSDKKKIKKRAKKTFQKVLFFLWVAWEVYIFKKKNLQKNKKISSLKKKMYKWKKEYKS